MAHLRPEDGSVVAECDMKGKMREWQSLDCQAEVPCLPF